MRITGNTLSDSLIQQLTTLLARQNRLQNQATTGQRIQAPEDDPAAVGQALNLQAQTGATAQYAQNISTLQSQSTLFSNAVQSLKTITDRAGEITVQADATKTPDQMQAYASEVGQLIQQALQIANTKDSNGQYLFAGTNGGQSPFAATTDNTGKVTAVRYQGNTSVAQADIGPGTSLGVQAPGANNSGAGPRGVFADSRFGADLFGHLIALRDHLLAGSTNAISSTDHAALRNDEEGVIFQSANSGVIRARLDTASSDTDSQKAALQQTLTSVAGADLTSTLVQLSQTQNAYQVALQSSARLLQLQQSLLNYLP